MSELKHLFRKDDNYYMVDGENLSIYKLPRSINYKLDKYDENELDKIGNDLIYDDGKKATKINVNNRKCNRLILVLSTYCNLACKYCYAHGGNYCTEKLENMSIETLKNAIQNIYAMYPEGVDSIQFFGGEPLMNKVVLREGVEYINEYCNINKFDKPKYTIVTNGTIVDDEIIDIFQKYFESVTISLDGDKYINDLSRVYKGNNESVYDKVKNNIDRMNRKNRTYKIGLEITVTSFHIDDYIKNKTMDSIYNLLLVDVDNYHIAPVFNNMYDNYNFDNIEIKYLKEFFDNWTKKLFEKRRNEKRITSGINTILRMFVDRCYLGNGCGAVYTDVAINTNGDIYPCFMFIGENEFNLGNVNSFVHEEYTNKNLIIRDRFVRENSNDKCDNCWAKKLCSTSYGHCIGARWLMNKKLDKPIQWACELGKSMVERNVVGITENYGIYYGSRENKD